MTELQAVGLFGGLLLAAVGVGEGLRQLGWPGEASRRAVHALVGLTTAASPSWFDRPRGIVALAVVFLVANAVARSRAWLPGVHAIGRASWGTVTFPLALLVALALCWGPVGDRVWALQVAFAVLALADPAASLAGTRVRSPVHRVGGATKSMAGSATFAVIAFGTTASLLAALRPEPSAAAVLGAAAVVAALATVAEALGHNGWDNLWIVLAVVVPLAWLDSLAGSVPLGLVAVGAAVAFAWATWRVRAPDGSGALAGSLLAWGLVAVGGWAWAVPALVFFVLSSALSRLGRHRKREAEARVQKGSRRDAGQVMANGGVGLALLAASVVVASDALYWAFVASFAAAAADTWGTEIGTAVGGPTRRLGVGRAVPPGTSGGMSMTGTVGGVAGAASVVGPAVALSSGLSVGAGLALVAVAVGAAALDSALGATVQARYRAPDGALTERAEVAGHRLPLATGRAWLDNDGVNAACTVAAAVGALALWAAAG
ncbi:DUF92 domain-containing protein [Rubrivirga sp.]|uniref:DUF92 domain-containing protein n=1 Tax=Rubrivirga sp. TaxID=1885344 RepID=UPI003B517B51